MAEIGRTGRRRTRASLLARVSMLASALAISLVAPVHAIEPSRCSVTLAHDESQPDPRILYLVGEVEPVGDVVLTFSTEMHAEFGGEVREGTLEGSGREFVVHPARAYWKVAFRPASDTVTAVRVVAEAPGVCRAESSASVAPALPETATVAGARPAGPLIVLGALLSLLGGWWRRRIPRAPRPDL